MPGLSAEEVLTFEPVMSFNSVSPFEPVLAVMLGMLT